MIATLFRRIIIAIPTLLFLSLVVFALLELTPGDVALAVLDESASEEQIEMMREELGLNDYFLERYFNYIGGLLRADMGKSVRTERPVIDEIKVRLPYTLALLGSGIFLGTIMGMSIGALSAAKHGTAWDTLITAFISIGMATPVFWLALLLVDLFAMKLHWVNVFGANSAKDLILPAVCTAFTLVPGVARLTRTGLLEVFGADFILTARAKGLPGRSILLRHISPHTAITIVTYIGLRAVRLISVTTVMEVIFSWPGLGGLAVKAAFDRDPMVLQGTTLTIATITFIILFFVDIIVLRLDPRITYKAV
jgi:peptide/nickel transport system permease protein